MPEGTVREGGTDVKQIPISQVDALFSNGRYPIEFLFLYRSGFSTRNLRRALRTLAPVFWPVFGEYRRGAISFDRYREEDFFDEESVGHALDPADVEGADWDTISRFGQKELSKLFFLKATRFTNGIVLVPKMNHVAGDGFSFFFFLSALAALTRAAFFPFKSPLIKALFKPVHRRTGLREFSFQADAPAPVVQGEPLTVESVEIPKRDVQALVREAAASEGLRISSNDILSAMAVRKLAGIRGHQKGAGFRLTIPIDVRGQVRDYGRRFFGNGLMLHTMDPAAFPLADSTMKDTAVRIRKFLPRVSRESYIGYLSGLERLASEKRWAEFRPYDPDKGCLVTNLSKLPAERLDFGTGGPQVAVPLTVEKNSVAVLARSDNYVLRYAY
jgi:hypothetical protein